MASLEDIRQERLKKIQLLKEAGQESYPIKTGPIKEIKEVVEKFSALAKTKRSLSVAGRLLAKRTQGGLIFFDLNDGSGKIQGLLKKDEIGAKEFDLFDQTVDIGDWLWFKGSLFLTKRQEKTLLVKSWKMLVKSLRPLPDKWHGLQDIEERFRHRYLDSLMTSVVKDRFLLRSKMITEIRKFLDLSNFIEVETPILQSLAGGATAKPFTTHHKALDIDLYLRVSPELYLKQMLVGGFPKVYEIGRNFRNEGIDQTHNPEFTMLEFYEAFSNAEEQRLLVEKFFKQVIKKTLGTLLVSYNGQSIDFSKKFKIISYFDLLKRYALINNPLGVSLDELTIKAQQLGVEVQKSDSTEKILDNIFKKSCRPKIIEPTFVIDYPRNYLPLAKRKEPGSEIVDAFQLVAGGLELVKAFSELNDPIDQRERFEAQEKIQQAGDGEAQTTDESFLEALEYGMPPAGGVGIGIDRLIMLLTDTTNIREVIFFPTLRPK